MSGPYKEGPFEWVTSVNFRSEEITIVFTSTGSTNSYNQDDDHEPAVATFSAGNIATIKSQSVGMETTEDDTPGYTLPDPPSDLLQAFDHEGVYQPIGACDGLLSPGPPGWQGPIDDPDFAIYLAGIDAWHSGPLAAYNECIARIGGLFGFEIRTVTFGGQPTEVPEIHRTITTRTQTVVITRNKKAKPTPGRVVALSISVTGGGSTNNPVGSGSLSYFGSVVDGAYSVKARLTKEHRLTELGP